MDVILVQPKFRTHIVTPPLGLGYLASMLRLRGHKVRILDCIRDNVNTVEFRKILDGKKPDLVGVNAMTTYYPEAVNYIKVAKDTGVYTVLGGPHATALPENTLQTSEADFIIHGEGEETLIELADVMERGGIEEDFTNMKGLAFRGKGGGIRVNPPRPLIDNLDALPYPAWDMMPPNKYLHAPHGAVTKNYPVAPIITTRGCPFDCSFCSSKVMWKQKLRYRSPANVVDEMELLVKNFGVREFHIEDDNFTVSKSHAIGVCQEIIDRGLNISWSCPNGVRIDRIDREMLELMKESGCYLLAFGIESGSQEILDRHNKKLDLSIVPGTLKMVKDASIETWGFFIIGLPGESRKTILETIKFSKSIPLDRAQYCIFTPLPGSCSFKEWVENKQVDLQTIDWTLFNFYNIVYETDDLSGSVRKSLQKRAFREFYLRPKVLFNIIRRVRLNQIGWLAKRFMQYRYA